MAMEDGRSGLPAVNTQRNQNRLYRLPKQLQLLGFGSFAPTPETRRHSGPLAASMEAPAPTSSAATPNNIACTGIKTRRQCRTRFRMAAHLIAVPFSEVPGLNEGGHFDSDRGNRDIVIVASGETGSVPAWSPGLGYYDPGST